MYKRFISITNKAVTLILGVVLTSVLAVSAFGAPDEQKSGLDRQVRHELLMLPYYGIFDNLEYSINGGTVTLRGQVVRPTTSSDAVARVRKLQGVTNVVNEIEVLPLSPFDDQIRGAEYRAIFSKGSLGRYAMGTNPSLHIIVDHGHVSLEGVVDNQMDKNLAELAAKGVFGVFSVTNNLRITGRS